MNLNPPARIVAKQIVGQPRFPTSPVLTKRQVTMRTATLTSTSDRPVAIMAIGLQQKMPRP
jgi:hypothetical protein